MIPFTVRLITLVTIFFSLAAPAAAEKRAWGPYTIPFALGSAEPDPAGQAALQEIIDQLADMQVSSVLVEGYTDNSQPGADSPFDSNEQLSLSRAQTIATQIRRQSGLPAKLFESFGHGSSNPISSNDTAAGRRQNRRVEVRLNGVPLTALPPSPEESPIQAMNTNERITISFRETPVVEAYEMLAKLGQKNIVVERGVSGDISLNLYDVTLEEAITTVALASGYEVTSSAVGYLVHGKRLEIAAPAPPVITEIRTFKVNYTDPDKAEEMIGKHLSGHGKVTALADRKVLVVEDVSEHLVRIEALMAELEREPSQILIEAKILEVILEESESFGLEWWKIFSSSDALLHANDDGLSTGGVRGLTNSTTGFIFELVNDNVNVSLNALKEEGRVRTLSTPKLLTTEHKEASVIIGDRQGYKTITTVNEVTSESVEFLESGIILKVTPAVDNEGRIIMDIHPEVSTGSVADGIPSQTTTEVSTVMLASSGQTIFIGGLLKKKTDTSEDGVPVLGDIPVLGHIFSSSKEILENTETVVLITPYIVTNGSSARISEQIQRLDKVEAALDLDLDRQEE